MTTREDYTQQNPHQHLFSSNSFHTFSHASHRTDIAHDSYMFDINLLLGTGWNDFEIQM
jgi:hypothetical protein